MCVLGEVFGEGGGVTRGGRGFTFAQDHSAG